MRVALASAIVFVSALCAAKENCEMEHMKEKCDDDSNCTSCVRRFTPLTKVPSTCWQYMQEVYDTFPVGECTVYDAGAFSSYVRCTAKIATQNTTCLRPPTASPRPSPSPTKKPRKTKQPHGRRKTPEPTAYATIKPSDPMVTGTPSEAPATSNPTGPIAPTDPVATVQPTIGTLSPTATDPESTFQPTIGIAPTDPAPTAQPTVGVTTLSPVAVPVIPGMPVPTAMPTVKKGTAKPTAPDDDDPDSSSASTMAHDTLFAIALAVVAVVV